MKKYKIIFWITAILIFLFEGVMPLLTFNSQLALDAMKHLGYPNYFGVMLTAFKVVGALVLIIPAFKGRYKEWAYAGFGIVFISAFVSNWAVDGLNMTLLFPVIAFAILIASYFSYFKLESPKN